MEGEKVPIINRVIPAIHSVVNGFHRRDKDRSLIRVPSAIEDQPGDLAEATEFRELISTNLRAKVSDHLLLVHYQATLLCPATKGITYLSDYEDGEYAKRDEAIKDLKALSSWLSQEIARREESRDGTCDFKENNKSGGGFVGVRGHSGEQRV